MAYAWRHYPELHASQLIVPVPLHDRQERQRGYNQAESLARALGGDIGRAVVPLLERARKTKTQTKLTRKERKTNMEGAFQIAPRLATECHALKGRPILLVDDVCTTGSTLGACLKALRKAQLGPVRALVLARDL